MKTDEVYKLECFHSRDEINQYLNNASNKEEILKNFARVTIYNKHLSITKIEEVEAYSLDNLFSDIGTGVLNEAT